MLLGTILLNPLSNSNDVAVLDRVSNLSDTGPAVSNGTLLMNATFGTNDNEEATSLIQLESGGFAIAGNAYGKAGAVDFWLVRTDANGHHLWNRSYDAGQKEYCRSVIECEDGGFALFGVTRVNQPTSADFWLVRTNSTGHPLWNATFGTTQSDEGYEVTELIDGGFGIAGYFQNATSGNLDYLLIRLDADGDHLWNRTYGGPNDDYCFSLIETNDGGFALAGTYGNSTDEDAMVIRTDSNGNYLWNSTIGGALDDYANDIIEVSEGGFAVTGSTESFGVTNTDLWLIRLDADGTCLWNKTYDGSYGADEGYGLTQMSDGGFAIVGDMTVNGGGTSLWLLRTGKTGELVWNVTYGITGDSATSIITLREGGMAFAGTTASLGAGGTDYWLLIVPELIWVEIPSDIVLGSDDPLNRDLNAISAAGVESWSLNDTAHFQIDSSGVLTNVTTLAIGSYGLIVTVTDTLENQLIATITITVVEAPHTGTNIISTTTTTTTGTLPPPPNGYPPPDLGVIAAIAVGAVAAVVVIVVILHKKGVISQ